jgi:hypothetical protein
MAVDFDGCKSMQQTRQGLLQQRANIFVDQEGSQQIVTPQGSFFCQGFIIDEKINLLKNMACIINGFVHNVLLL